MPGPLKLERRAAYTMMVALTMALSNMATGAVNIPVAGVASRIALESGRIKLPNMGLMGKAMTAPSYCGLLTAMPAFNRAFIIGFFQPAFVPRRVPGTSRAHHTRVVPPPRPERAG